MKKLIQKSVGIGILTMLMFSCKLQPFEIDNPEQYSTVFMQSANETFIANTYVIEDQWYSLAFGAGYGGFNELNSDLEVTFEVRPDLVEEYNRSNGTDYRTPPGGSYRIQQDKVTIPAGKAGSNSIALEVNPINFQGTDPILIPVTITGTNGNIKINEELRTTYFVVNGVYKKVFILSANETSSSTYDIEDEWHPLTVGVRYDAIKELNQDVEITFAVQDELVATYNSSNGTNYATPPNGSYRIVQNKATIPAGETESTGTLEVNPSFFQGTPILIPVTITAVSGDLYIDEQSKTTYFLVSGTPQYLSRTGWTATSPTQHDNGNNAAQNTLDGIFTTIYHSKYGVGGGSGHTAHAPFPHAITVDMKSNQTLHGVHIHGRRPSGSQTSGSQTYLYPSVIVIEVSVDGNTWVNVGQNLPEDNTNARRSVLGTTPRFMTELQSPNHTSAKNDSPNSLIYFSQSVDARYFRITVYDNHAVQNLTVSLSEIEAF